MELIKRMWARRPVRLILGAVLGAGAGLTYWGVVGCSSGACPITGNPYIASCYGALLGIIAVV
jgi:hypothetical protein